MGNKNVTISTGVGVGKVYGIPYYERFNLETLRFEIFEGTKFMTSDKIPWTERFPLDSPRIWIQLDSVYILLTSEKKPAQIQSTPGPVTTRWIVYPDTFTIIENKQ